MNGSGRDRWAAAAFAALVAMGLGGCAVDDEGGPEQTQSASQGALAAGQFLYLRCNSTDWNVSDASRLVPTANADVLQLTLHVTQSWAVNDQCIFTLVTATQPDSWGSAQTNYTDSKPSTAIAVPGGDSIVGPQSSQTNFNVKYPSVGTYQATVTWSAKTFTIGAPGSADAGVSRDAASMDATADAARTGDASARTGDTSTDAPAVDVESDQVTPDASADGAPDAPADAGPDASVLDAGAPDASTAAPTPDASMDGAGVAASIDAGATDAGVDAMTPDAAFDATVDAGVYAPPTGGYTIQCPWLLDPSSGSAGGTSGPGTMREHLLSSADFYTKVFDDPASGGAGGYFTYLDQRGSPKSTNKSFEVQSRDAYAFARAFMVSGDTSYLTSARQALDFLSSHGWDATNGGFVFLGDQNGNWLPAPSGVPSDKWSFTQHYCLAGFTAMCEATGDPGDCGWMNTGMQLLETHYWDSVNGSYFNNATINYSSTWEKGFTPTVDGITPHILLTYLITQNPTYLTRFVSLSDDLVNHLVASMTAPASATAGAGPVVFGFPEFYQSNWAIENNTYGFVGHLYKTAWALARAYLVTQNTKYRDAARQVLIQLWNGGGFDHTNGAPNFDYNFNSGPGSSNKEYWQIEQGFTSGITNWYIATTDADRATYLEQADRSLCFFMQHMPDLQFGGIFFETNPDGSALVGDGSDSSTDKGDQWEGSYHNVEFSYYAYVYGNLLLWRRPITLYYDFNASADEVVSLNPIAIESGALVITGITFNGQPYAAFDGVARTLTLPAGTSGIFAVTYAHTP